MRNFVFGAREHDRAAVWGNVGVRVTAGSGSSCWPWRSALAGNVPNAQRLPSPGIEENRGAVGSEAGINFRSLPGSDLASLSPVCRSNPKMPQAVSLIARIDNFLTASKTTPPPHSRTDRHNTAPFTA